MRQRDQDGRVDERRDRLPLHRGDDLGVLDEPPEHSCRDCRCAPRRRAMPCRCSETGCRARAKASDSAMPPRTRSCTSSRTERKIGARDPSLQQIKRLHQWHAGAQQRGEFLVEHEELAHRDRRCGAADGTADRRSRPLGRSERTNSPFSSSSCRSRDFGVGDIHAFDNLAGVRRQPAVELHRSGASRKTATDCRRGHYS